jgi:hypothetical protein
VEGTWKEAELWYEYFKELPEYLPGVIKQTQEIPLPG